MKRSPKTCERCGLPATHMEQVRFTAARITMSGTVNRWPTLVITYWCDEHASEQSDNPKGNQ